MPANEVEQVLANWIEQELSPIGSLPPETSPAQWVAVNFLRWWRQGFQGSLDDTLGDAEAAASAIRSELIRLGGWEEFGEAFMSVPTWTTRRPSFGKFCH